MEPQACHLKFEFDAQRYGYVFKIPIMYKTQTRPHVFVSFENTISNPLKTVNDLSEFLKIELKEDTISDIYKFVVPRAEMKEMKEEMRKKKVKHKMLAKFRRYLAKKISRRSDS